MKYGVEDIKIFLNNDPSFSTEFFNGYVNLELNIRYNSELFIEKHRLKLVSLAFIKEEIKKNKSVFIKKSLILDYFGEKEIKELINSFLKHIIFFKSMQDLRLHLETYLEKS